MSETDAKSPGSHIPWPLKLFLALGGFMALVAVLWTAGRITGHLQFYHVPSAGNEPTIPMGGYILASDLVEPARQTMTCYHQRHPNFERSVWIQRVAGVEGDTVELRSGTLFVNGSDMDAGLVLKHGYLVSPLELRRLLKNGVLRRDEAYPRSGTDSLVVPLIDPDAVMFGISQRAGTPGLDTTIAAEFGNHGWTADDFGPVVVPQGHLFMLGDNRNYSLDSRCIGFVDRENVIGTMFATLEF